MTTDKPDWLPFECYLLTRQSSGLQAHGMSESLSNVTEAAASMTITNSTTANSTGSGQHHLTALNNDSSSYAFIEYFLRLSMHASTAKILSAWEVSNPQLTLQFEKRSKVC